ncbi:MAG: chorismate mutase [Candidatus Dormibacteraceae bacterium]
MSVRGIRGATTAEGNQPEAILRATRELLEQLVKANQLDISEIAFAHLTTTPDLNTEFPARAARLMGWVDVPLLCGHEMDIRPPHPLAVPRCVRVALLYNTERKQNEMVHVYLHGAKLLQVELNQTREA